MGLRKHFFRFESFVSTKIRINRRAIWWLLLFAAIGIAIGIIIICNPKLTYHDISKHLLDPNILKVITPKAGLGGLVFARVFDLSITFVILFIVSLNRWSVVLAFPIISYRTFAMVINLYWILAKFGIFFGWLLFLIYLIWFLIITLILIAMTVFILHETNECRKGGFRGAFHMKDMWIKLVVFVGIFAAIGFSEWLLYSLILSKLVFAVYII